MRNVLRRRPSAAMIVAIVALVAALAGTAVAAGTIKLGALTTGAQNKTVGPGKLTYVTVTTLATQLGVELPVTASCPSGLEVIGGGIKVNQPNVLRVVDSYPTTTGWTGHVQFNNPAQSATATAICANSRVVTGAPPSS